MGDEIKNGFKIKAPLAFFDFCKGPMNAPMGNFGSRAKDFDCPFQNCFLHCAFLPLELPQQNFGMDGRREKKLAWNVMRLMKHHLMHSLENSKRAG